MNKALRTNKNNERDKIIIILLTLVISLAILLAIVWIGNYEEDRQEELNKMLNESYDDGIEAGQIQIVKDIYYYKEFPKLVYNGNETLIDAVKMCDTNFLKYYYNEVC